MTAKYNIREILEGISKNFDRKGKFSKNGIEEIHKLSNVDNSIATFSQVLNRSNNKFKINPSIGLGNWAYNTYIAIINTNISNSPQRGFYIVYLFDYNKDKGNKGKNIENIYLSLNQGTKHYTDLIKEKQIDDVEESLEVVINNTISKYFDDTKIERDFGIGKINNNHFYGVGKNYPHANIIGKKYDSKNLPSNDDLIKDLEYLIDVYDNVVQKLPSTWEVHIKESLDVKEKLEDELVNEIKEKLMKSKNLILRGAPGTGKTYLAKQVAAEMLGLKLKELEGSDQFQFVQFHPNYDYADFVQGLRPIFKTSDGSEETSKDLGFELKDGIFKQFCDGAGESFKKDNKKKYIFVIDEINRGDLSKIFGELFFSLDPDYRGEKGEVTLQFSNMKDQPAFFVPENIYIIGTMNDIDRSVESFDFAMRRRFRFIEIKPEYTQYMLDKQLSSGNATLAKEKMNSLNETICNHEDIGRILGENFQVGASYFTNITDLMAINTTSTQDFKELWDDYLSPLLEDYLLGYPNVSEKMMELKKAYDLENIGDANSDVEEQVD